MNVMMGTFRMEMDVLHCAVLNLFGSVQEILLVFVQVSVEMAI